MTFTYEYLRKFQNYLESESGAHMGVTDGEKKSEVENLVLLSL
jgi:hypothetical protein